ncbi:MAG: winged helix-turn-helix transcriptional regulator, partial [Eubacteriales bacterium]|nr:winged helix-turn-helix transcriptional regulator [Eubacteriales bacterium]
MKNSIVYRLLARPLRFEELRRALPEMGKQELTGELERLGQAGLILRNRKNRYAWA